MTASLKNPIDGILRMKMTFTGTATDVMRAKERLLEVGLNGEAQTPSAVRDLTGSGVEHRPDGTLENLLGPRVSLQLCTCFGNRSSGATSGLYARRLP